LNISPKAYILNENNKLKQDFTIVEYIEGENIVEFGKSEIKLLAKDFIKLHTFPKTYDKKELLPYSCSLYNEFADGEDKKIETYDFKDIDQVAKIYNNIKKELEERFNALPIFETCKNLCICHGDLKSENILKTKK
jgi:thiamine kinase-like enzyme